MKPAPTVQRDGAGAAISAALQRMSARERGLAVALGLIVLVAAAVGALDWAQAQQDRELAALAALQVRQDAALKAARGGLGRAERAQLAAAAGWSLQAPDIWIARVRIEEQLAGAAAAAGVKDPTIEVAAGVEGEGAAPAVKAEISAPYVKAAFVRLLQQVHAGPHAVLVERVQVQAKEDPRFKLTLLYPVASDLQAVRP